MSVLLRYLLPNGAVDEESILPESDYCGLSALHWVGEADGFEEDRGLEILSIEDQTFGDGSQIHEVTLVLPSVH